MMSTCELLLRDLWFSFEIKGILPASLIVVYGHVILHVIEVAVNWGQSGYLRVSACVQKQIASWMEKQVRCLFNYLSMLWDIFMHKTTSCGKI